MQRRKFLKTSLLAPFAASIAATFTSCSNEHTTSPFKGKRLIILRLDGGNDALYTLAPNRNEQLQRLRPTLYKATQDKGIAYHGWVLHKQWSTMHDLMLSGDACLIANVGYPENVWSGSHFLSSNIWETGMLPDESQHKTGWIGRLLDKQAFESEIEDWPVLKLDKGQRMFDRGLYNTGINWFGNETYHAIQPYAQKYYSNIPLKEGTGYKTYLLHQRLARIYIDNKYSQSPLGQQFAYTEAIIKEELPIKVIHLAQTGYDTHVNTAGTLPALHGDLLSNLKLFVSSLKTTGYWNETQIFIYSEFGRTLEENANGGTDHGTASHIFTLGGIDLFGNPQFTHAPTFDTFELNANHYVKHQIDFRKILSRYESGWLV